MDPAYEEWTIQAINDQESDEYTAFQNAISAYSALRVADTQSVQSNIGRIPSSIDVCYHRVDKHHGAEPTASFNSNSENAWKQWTEEPYFSINIETDEDLDSGFGTKGILWDDLSAINDPFNGPFIFGANFVTNQAALQSRAEERTEDFAIAVGDIETFDTTYSGIINDPGFYPSTIVSGYSVGNYGDGFVTNIINSEHPLSVSATADWVEMWESINQYMSPPDIAKATTPDYPEVTQWVQPVSLSSNPDLYLGIIGILDTRPISPGRFWQTGECWIYNNSDVPLTVGNTYIGRMIGQFSGIRPFVGTTFNGPFFACDGTGSSLVGIKDTETFFA